MPSVMENSIPFTHGTKAIMIKGAKRIGKSTIVEEFAKQEYESYILIDFAKKDKVVEDYFNQYRRI